MRQLYLDNAATTPIDKNVLKNFTKNSKKYFANPSSQHSLGKEAKEELEDAREKLIVLKGLLEGIQESDWNVEHINEKVFSFIKEKEFGTGDALWPLRIALSGQKNSPGPFDIMGVLGKEESFKRIDVAIEKLS